MNGPQTNFVIEIRSKQELQKLLNENRLVLIDFYAPWCAPCMAIKDHYANLASKYPDCKFVQCNYDDPNLASVFYEYGIQSFPSFKMIKDRKVFQELVGADYEGLTRMVSTAIASIREQQSYAPGSVISADSEAQLKYLLGTEQIVILCFSASWCHPCKALEPVFAELAKKYPQYKFVKCDFDALSQTAAEDYNIKSVPSIVVLRNGVQIEKLKHPSAKDLTSCLQTLN